MNNPKKPFKVTCTNCGKEVLVEHKEFTLEDKEIEVYGQPFYDSAIVFMECNCGNEIEK